MQALTQSEVKVFVDTAPVMEKPLAARAGLGWQGKHTNLVSREFGSWLFIGAIFTTAEIAPDLAEEDHCGACRRCLDICPTHAFTAPYEIDARACISYLTIEHKGHRAALPRSDGEPHLRLRRLPRCLPLEQVCAKRARGEARGTRGSDNPPLSELLVLDDAAFRARYRGTPIKRTGRDRFMRNVLIAAGNSDDASLAPLVEARLDDPSPLVRDGGGRSRGTPRRFNATLRGSHCAGETDPGEKRMAGGGGMNRLFAFGLGFSALTLAKRLSAEGWQIAGTARDDGKVERLEREGYDVVRFSGDAGNPGAARHLAGATHLIHSIPPGPGGDPVLKFFREAIAALPSLRMGRLSTVGIYGDQEGGWVDESTAPNPNSARTGARVAPRTSLAPIRARDWRSGARVPARGHLRTGTVRVRQGFERARRAASTGRAGVQPHPCRGYRERARSLDRQAARRRDLQCRRRRRRRPATWWPTRPS